MRWTTGSSTKSSTIKNWGEDDMPTAPNMDVIQERSRDAPTTLLQRVRLRKPEPTDGARLLELVSSCSELDRNSLYCYLILCTHFRDTCIVAEYGSELVGFVSGYREPARPDVFFCWQVAVAASMRRSGLATAMLRSIFSNPTNIGMRLIEATVTRHNCASMHLFQRLAADLGLPCDVEMLFSESHFAPWKHDAEWLVTIGPSDLQSSLARSDRRKAISNREDYTMSA
jgi:L-2,4-diaminobutyric acid acetyltransferase